MPRPRATGPTAAKAAKPKAPRGPKAHKLAPSLPEGELLVSLKKQWRVGKAIGQGGFGLLYLASDDISKPVDDSAAYVVKVEPLSNGPLFCEMHAYQRIARAEIVTSWIKPRKLTYLGMPKYVASGSHDKDSVSYRFLIMPRFGTDLQKLFENAGRRFSETTVLALGIRLLDVLEFMHDNEYVHADIKASNLLLGFQAGKTLTNQVYLVDFGLAYRYCVDGKHKEYKEDPRMAHDGTIEFTSCDAHKGVCASRRGDLEILGYCLLQWLCGRLPWEDKLGDKEYVKDQKLRYQKNIPSLMKACFPNTATPDYLQAYLTHVKGLGYTERPDYDKCRNIFRKSLLKLGQKNEWALNLQLDVHVASPTKGRKRTLSPAKGATPAKQRLINGDSDSPVKSPKAATSARSKPAPKNPKTGVKKSTAAENVSPSKGKQGRKRTLSPAEGVTLAKLRLANGDSDSPVKSPKVATSARSKPAPKKTNPKPTKTGVKKSTAAANVSPTLVTKGKRSSLKGKSPKLSKEELASKLNIPGTARIAPVHQRLKAKVSSPKAVSNSKSSPQKRKRVQKQKAVSSDMSVQTSPGLLKRR